MDYDFPFIGNVITQLAFIFFRGVETTNQFHVFFSGDLIGILGDFMGISGDLMGNYGTTWGYYCNFWEFLGTSWDIKPTVYTLATGGLDWSCYLN